MLGVKEKFQTQPTVLQQIMEANNQKLPLSPVVAVSNLYIQKGQRSISSLFQKLQNRQERISQGPITFHSRFWNRLSADETDSLSKAETEIFLGCILKTIDTFITTPRGKHAYDPLDFDIAYTRALPFFLPPTISLAREVLNEQSFIFLHELTQKDKTLAHIVSVDNERSHLPKVLQALIALRLPKIGELHEINLDFEQKSIYISLIQEYFLVMHQYREFLDMDSQGKPAFITETSKLRTVSEIIDADKALLRKILPYLSQSPHAERFFRKIYE